MAPLTSLVKTIRLCLVKDHGLVKVNLFIALNMLESVFVQLSIIKTLQAETLHVHFLLRLLLISLLEAEDVAPPTYCQNLQAVER